MSALSRLLGELLRRPRKPGGAHGDVEALFRKCVDLSDRARLDLACDCYRELLRMDPAHARAHNNLGILHQRRGEIDAAIGCFNDAARANPALAEPHINLGNLRDIQGDPDTAVKHYRQALGLDPEHAQAHCSLAQALLATGAYEAGWEEFEWRWRTGNPRLRQPPVAQPLWDGTQDVAGKRVLLRSEQGYGDAIQFIRYAPMVAARDARVLVVCEEALRTLFRTVAGIDTVAEPGDPFPDFDYHVPLMSLPRAFKTRVGTIPGKVPYLSAEPGAVEAWTTRLAPHASRLKVGLAWAGSPTFIAARMKSCPAEELAKLSGAPDCAFFSLQKGAAGSELKRLRAAGMTIVDHTGALEDFSATAALVGALDLVITVDTAVAHLAGALGKPVWVLLAHAPDWRWLPRGGASAWYPTATLFRQPREDDWQSVIAEVRQALRQKAAAFLS